MQQQAVLSNQDGAVFEIQINRPSKMNALTDAMYGELRAKLKQAEANDSVKVIVLRSSGAHFSAGNDLADFLETQFDLNSNVIQFLFTIAQLTKPIIAAVNGAAIGIGTTLLLHCDLVYGAQDTKFALPFIKLGLTPEGGSSQLLAKRCGEIKANEWLLTGRNILADEALSSGLINQVCEDAETTWETSMKAAHKLAKSSMQALIETKKLLKGQQITSVLEIITKEAEIFAQRLESDEAKAAFDAFLNK